MDIQTIGGVQVDIRTNTVVDGTVPVSQRGYYGSRIPLNIVCFKDGKYCNVELFQPVLYDKEQAMPKFDVKWIQYDNPAAKNRKIVKIHFSYAYKAWWYEQRRRCLEGYTVGGVYLTGEYYFYLNFWKIRAKGRGLGWITPNFIDMQKELFDLVEKARKENKNILTLKRRQIGFSECYSSMMGHEYTFYPLSRGLIVGGQDTYATKTLSCVRGGLDAFHPSVTNAGREFYKRRKSGLDRDDFFECGLLDPTGAKMGYLCQVEAITTLDNVQAANGKTPTFCLLEEAGINRHLSTVYEMILPSIQEKGKQDGRIIAICGTGGEMSMGAAKLMDMFYNPAKYDILVSDEVYEEGISGTAHFFPAWKWFVTDNDGNSYKEAGIELIQKEREKKQKGLTTYKTQMPLTPSDAFIISGSCPFNVTKLEQQQKALLSIGMKEYMQYGRFEWVFDISKEQQKDLAAIMAKRKPTGVRWVPCPQGCEAQLDNDGDLMYPVALIEHPDRPTTKEGEQGFEYLFTEPRYHGLYKAGMDPYNKDEAESTTSQGSITIAKGYLDGNHTHNLFPCSLTWRPCKKDKFYEMSVMMQCYYGLAKVLIEWSNDAPLDWYKNNGWEFLLKERPLVTQAEMIDSHTVNRYGIDPNTKHVWEEHYAQYIEDYFFHMTDPFQVERALAYRKKKGYNCDKTISCMLAWEHVLDDIHIGVKVRDTKEKKTNSFTYGWINIGGRMIAL